LDDRQRRRLLPAPVESYVLGNRLLMALAERSDLIVDFTNVAEGNYILANAGPDEPFKGFNEDGTLSDGEGGSIAQSDPATTGKIMQFRVVTAATPDLSTPPQFLVLLKSLPSHNRREPGSWR
jgi:hypothetical protein